MRQPIASTYRAAELQAAIDAVVKAGYLESQAHGLIKALHALGFRIIKTGPQS